MSQVVLVGATGFIGRNVNAALVSAGYEVVAVSRSGEVTPGAMVGLTLDGLESYAPLAPDAVLINTAAMRYDARTFAEDQGAILSANVALVQRVYDICVARGISEVRQASSVAVYPAGDALLQDADPLNLNAQPHAGEAFYGWSKRWGEILGELYAQRYGISTVNFRLTNPFGAFDTRDIGAAHVATAFILRALEPGDEFPLRGATVEKDFIYAGDVATAFVATVPWRGRRETFNLGRGRNTTLEQLALAVVAATETDKRIVRIDAAASGPAARRIDGSRVQAALGLEWLSLEAGLARTVAWYRDGVEP